MVGNEIVDVDLAFHVPIDNFGYVGTPTRTTKGAAFPDPAGNQLEGTGGNFCPGFGHTDDDRLPPTPMAAFQRLAHDIGIADTFKGIINAPIGHLDDVINHIVDLVGVNKVGHAEFAPQGFALGVDIHTDNFVCTDHFGALNHIQADTAQAKYGNIGTSLDPGSKEHSPNACGHPAADIANLVKRRVAANFGQCYLRDHNKIGKGRCAHVVMDCFSIQAKAGTAIGH